VSRPEARPPAGAVATIGAFLRAHAAVPGLTGVVVGLSGGVDSALVARLARDALGAERVLGVLLPDRGYPAALEAETLDYAHSLGITTRTVPIAPVTEAFRAVLPSVRDRVTLGNTAARVRMTCLYAIAREERRLVVGTGNKSELLLGYFTKYGDGGADLLPLGDLYKTDVWAIARELGVPPAIVDRPPTAGFWEGQTDEGELGLSYPDADRVLRAVEELRPEHEVASATGVAPEKVAAVLARVAAHRHKRRLPPIPKLGLRTVGVDWRD
jgi:NAD+ synthase